HSCSWCGGPFNGGNYPGCGSYPIIHLPLHEMNLHELSMMMNLGTPTPEPLVNSSVYVESNEDIEATHAYTPSLPFLTTMEPADTLLIGDEVISTTLARENDKLIKYSVDDLVLIPKESEVTSNSNLECDMHVNAHLPTTDVKEEKFYINSTLGEYVVDFLVKNKDIADLPKHLVKQLFSYLVKHLSSTKRMSDEPLGDDSKPGSYDVTFSNSLFDFNYDYTLCYDNPLFDEEFEDISSLTLLKELTAEIGIDDSIPTEFVDGYYDSKGDILFLNHLLIEETFFDPTPTSGGKTRVMETPYFGFHHMPSPRHAAYSSKEVMYRYYHPHLTSGDVFDLEIKKISSDESKAHIEVLSVLWGNRLPIPDGLFPLSK
nr:hypothetical protein [Tanacetum cinerariifolium]